MTVGTIAMFPAAEQKLYESDQSDFSSAEYAVVMALAGAGRIFQLMDEEPEVDEGYVYTGQCKR